MELSMEQRIAALQVEAMLGQAELRLAIDS